MLPLRCVVVYAILILRQLSESMRGIHAGQGPGYRRPDLGMSVGYGQCDAERYVITIGRGRDAVEITIVIPVLAYHAHALKYHVCRLAASKQHDRGPAHGHVMQAIMIVLFKAIYTGHFPGSTVCQEVLVQIPQTCELIASNHIISIKHQSVIPGRQLVGIHTITVIPGTGIRDVAEMSPVFALGCTSYHVIKIITGGHMLTVSDYTYRYLEVSVYVPRGPCGHGHIINVFVVEGK